MIGVAVILLGFGFYRVYSRPSATRNRVLMWVSSVDQDAQISNDIVMSTLQAVHNSGRIKEQ